MDGELLLSRRDLTSCSTSGSTPRRSTKRDRATPSTPARPSTPCSTWREQIADRAVRAAQQALRHRRAASSTDGRVRLPAEVKAALDAVRRGRADRRRHGRARRRHAAAAGRPDGLLRVVPGREHRHLRSYPMLTVGNANLLLAHGSPEQVDALRPADARGPLPRHDVPVRAAGRLVARRHRDPRRAAGRRQLPALRHQDVDLRRRPRAGREHRAPRAGQDPGRPAGRASGISLFIVPKFLSRRRRSANATTSRSAGLNHKMGYRGTVNTVLSFGEGRTAGRRAGAVGYLVGEPHQRPRRTCST